MKMRLLQFAIPAKLGVVVAGAVTRIAGGATLLEAGQGWWVNGSGEVEKERVNWLIVGVDRGRENEVISVVKDILRSGGESAVFYVRQNKPVIEWIA